MSSKSALDLLLPDDDYVEESIEVEVEKVSIKESSNEKKSNNKKATNEKKESNGKLHSEDKKESKKNGVDKKHQKENEESTKKQKPKNEEEKKVSEKKEEKKDKKRNEESPIEKKDSNDDNTKKEQKKEADDSNENHTFKKISNGKPKKIQSVLKFIDTEIKEMKGSKQKNEDKDIEENDAMEIEDDSKKESEKEHQKKEEPKKGEKRKKDEEIKKTSEKKTNEKKNEEKKAVESNTEREDNDIYETEDVASDRENDKISNNENNGQEYDEDFEDNLDGNELLNQHIINDDDDNDSQNKQDKKNKADREKKDTYEIKPLSDESFSHDIICENTPNSLKLRYVIGEDEKIYYNTKDVYAKSNLKNWRNSIGRKDPGSRIWFPGEKVSQIVAEPSLMYELIENSKKIIPKEELLEYFKTKYPLEIKSQTVSTKKVGKTQVKKPTSGEKSEMDEGEVHNVKSAETKQHHHPKKKQRLVIDDSVIIHECKKQIDQLTVQISKLNSCCKDIRNQLSIVQEGLASVSKSSEITTSLFSMLMTAHEKS